MEIVSFIGTITPKTEQIFYILTGHILTKYCLSKPFYPSYKKYTQTSITHFEKIEYT
jgi:hypothetical protein